MSWRTTDKRQLFPGHPAARSVQPLGSRYARPRKPAASRRVAAQPRCAAPHRGLRLPPSRYALRRTSRLATCAASHRDFRRRLSRRTRTPPPRRTKTPSLRSGFTKATVSACAPYCWCPAATHLIFRVARGAGGFVRRGGGVRVPEPCRRPTGLSVGMLRGEGRRPSSQGGIPTRWTARSAGRQGLGRSWSRVAQNTYRPVYARYADAGNLPYSCINRSVRPHNSS